MQQDRRGPSAARTEGTLRYGVIELDRARRVARCGAREAHLTPKESALLAVLLSAPGRVFTRQELLALVWQACGGLRTRTVDMHVRTLRRKLGAACRIVTVYRRGYRWQQEEPPP